MLLYPMPLMDNKYLLYINDKFHQYDHKKLCLLLIMPLGATKVISSYIRAEMLNTEINYSILNRCVQQFVGCDFISDEIAGMQITKMSTSMMIVILSLK